MGTTLQTGKQIGNFVITKEHPLPEINSTLIELRHSVSNAEVVYLRNDDPENLFSLCFKTHPESSNGVAHILEHTVLCGSKKYPVKDPFFSMTRRSLNTFMNALTGSDFTCYPAASQVPKDFYNLLEVYLDAVFYPDLRELSFSQEGHRLEFEIPSDPSSPLMYKGVVFNEMKGAMSSPKSRLYEALGEALYPDLTYRHNSGGNPKNIPDLSYEELKAFHGRYYHPSRCLFFFSGNMPLEPHLEFIEKHVLNHAEPLAPIPPIPLQKRFKKPKSVQVPYPFAPGQDPKEQTYVTLAWLTCSILNQEDAVALLALDSILMDTDASPLRSALMESGLCKGAGASIDTDSSEIPFMITCNGCEPEAAPKIESLVLDTLKEIAKRGINPDKIESSLHQLELQRSEILGDGWPYGLILSFRSVLLKQHGGNAEDGLAIHSIFNRLRERVKENPRFFSDLIEQYLINNFHRVLLTLYPDDTLMAKEAAEEREQLKEIEEQIDETKKMELVEKAQELEAFQYEQSQLSPDCLPKIHLKDVPKKGKEFSLCSTQLRELTVHHHDTFTNKILYADLVQDLPEIEVEELPYLSLLLTLIPQIGSGGRNYKDTLEFLHKYLGGLSASINLHPDVNDPQSLRPAFHLACKGLYRNTKQMFQVLQETFKKIDLTDSARIKTLINKHYAGLQAGINSNPLGYALGLSSAHLDHPSRIKHKMSGLEYYQTIRSIALNMDEELPKTIERLNAINTRLMHGNAPQLILTCDQAQFDELRTKEFYGLDQLPLKSYTSWSDKYHFHPLGSQGRYISSPVSFTGLAVQAPCFGDPEAPAICIAGNLFDNKTLHPAIREKGGAYGGGTKYSTSSGIFSFYAYRDPNLSKTLAAFHQAIDELIDGKFTTEDLEEAKLEVIQDLDDPVSPGSRGGVAYSWARAGKTFEVRQAFRERLLSCTSSEVIEAVKMRLRSQIDHGALVAFAGQTLLEREAKLLPKEIKQLDINSPETLSIIPQGRS